MAVLWLLIDIVLVARLLLFARNKHINALKRNNL